MCKVWAKTGMIKNFLLQTEMLLYLMDMMSLNVLTVNQNSPL